MSTAHFSPTALVVVGLLIAGALVTILYPSLPTLITHHSLLVTQPALPLPDKPSIAILAFTNLSGDPEQEYLSDGITEDLTTALAKVSGLFVIARNSAFVYKGKPVDVKAVSRELGVRYVVEGSVRKAGDRLRITAQLVDGLSAAHVWAESYDRELKDIFAVQDEVRQEIMLALKGKLTPEEQERFRRFPTNNLKAYEYLLRGVESFYRYTKEANMQARQLFEKALALDPQYAGAYAKLGWTYFNDWAFHWSQEPQQGLERAFELAQRARALDDSLPAAHHLLSWVYLRKQQPEQAIIEAERAIALVPNYDDSYGVLADALSHVGRPEEAIGWAEKAIRLNPRYPLWYWQLGQAYCLTGRYEEAIATLKKFTIPYPNILHAHLVLANAYSEVGREEEAQAAVAEALRISPKFSLEVMRQRWPYKDPAVLERQLAALRKAGLK